MFSLVIMILYSIKYNNYYKYTQNELTGNVSNYSILSREIWYDSTRGTNHNFQYDTNDKARGGTWLTWKY